MREFELEVHAKNGDRNTCEDEDNGVREPRPLSRNIPSDRRHAKNEQEIDENGLDSGHRGQITVLLEKSRAGNRKLL